MRSIFKKLKNIGGGNHLPLFCSDYLKWSEYSTALVFLLPAAVILGTFNFYPALYSFYLSFFKKEGFGKSKVFIGFGNYKELFSSPEFWNSLKVTGIYTVGMTIGALIIGLLLAVLLNSDIKGRAFYRTLYFIPVITPTIASGMVWKYLFDPSEGVVNNLLLMIGIEGPAWLSSTTWALVAIVIVGIWKRIGFNMVIYLAALQSIPQEYYESARIDGANSSRILLYITIPLLLPITFFLVIMSLIDAFQVFNLVYVMTKGGPIGATDVMGYFIYRYGFKYFELGYASATAFIMFIIIFLLTIFQWRYTRVGAIQQ